MCGHVDDVFCLFIKQSARHTLCLAQVTRRMDQAAKVDEVAAGKAKMMMTTFVGR
jgi:hypothetical protein